MENEIPSNLHLEATMFVLSSVVVALQNDPVFVADLKRGLAILDATTNASAEETDTTMALRLKAITLLLPKALAERLRA